MPPLISALWEQGAIVVLLLVVVWTGHKGYWSLVARRAGADDRARP